MECPYCGHGTTRVYNSRHTAGAYSVWRRRRCEMCRQAFTSSESVNLESVITVAGTPGVRKTEYSPARLTLSLARACSHRQSLDRSLDYLKRIIEAALLAQAIKNQGLVNKSDIVQNVAIVLKRYDPVAYVKYICQYREFADRAALRNDLAKL